jgi:scyllo-inositol 2-dehydrogenase (NADP+)
MSPIGTAIVALGYAARTFHIPLVSREPSLKLIGIVSSDPSKRKEITESMHLHAYSKLDEALNDPRVQLIVIASPHSAHADQAIASLRAGRHVVVDKPMCLSADEADRMFKAAHDARRVLTVFHNRRWDGGHLALKQVIQSGVLGSLRSIELAMNRNGLSRKSVWRNQAHEAGGRLVDLGIHLIDEALQLLDEPIASVTTFMQRDWPDADVESHATVVLRTMTHRHATLDVGSLTRYTKPAYLAIGTEATFVKFGADPQERALAENNAALRIEDEVQAPTLLTPKGPTRLPITAGRWESFYENVARAIYGQTPLAVTESQMRAAIRVLEAARRSSRDGRPVEITHI